MFENLFSLSEIGINPRAHRSVSEVQKYELLTTNQYLQQMNIIISILHDIQVQMDNNA